MNFLQIKINSKVFIYLLLKFIRLDNYLLILDSKHIYLICSIFRYLGINQVFLLGFDIMSSFYKTCL